MSFWNFKRAQRIAERERVDAFVATAPCNVAYATGFWTPGAYNSIEPCYAVLPVENPDVRGLIIFKACFDQAFDLGLVDLDIHVYGRFFYYRDEGIELSSVDHNMLKMATSPGPEFNELDVLSKMIMEYGLGHGVIALDEKGITADQFRYLQEVLPEAKWRMASNLFREIRIIKSPEEVQLIRAVARVTETGMHRALENAVRDMTELEMSRLITTEMVENDSVPVWLVVGFGEKSAHPNSTPSDRQLSSGDVIRFDVGARRLLYYSDLARIGALGEPPKRASRYYEALVAGQQAALDLVKPGAAVRDLFHAAVQTVRSQGIPHYSRNTVGHGIGVEFYDEPIIKQDSNIVLEQGMVINIETPYYELGFAGLQTEDTVVVTESGFDFLTSGERPLYKM